MAQGVCSRGTVKKAMPQRQRNAGNGAVVEEEQDGNAVRKACSSGAARRAMKCGESRMWPRGFVSVVPRER